MAKKKINKEWNSYIAKDGNRYMICANSEEGGKSFKGRYWKGNLCYNYTKVVEYTTAVVCDNCSRKLIDGPELKTGRQSTGRPRGWQFMKEFIDKAGNVFHKGKEQPKLKGKFKPTIIKQGAKPTKQQKKRAINIALRNINDLKKSLKNTVIKRDRAKLESKIRKLNKIASGQLPRNFDIVKFIEG